jgi:hypothetical protein
VAKGPNGASIEGPGLARPVVVDYSEGASVATEGLGALLRHSRLTDALIAAAGAPPPPGVILVTPSARRPPGRLGSRYVVTYDMGTPGDVIRQDLYPYADGGPVAHLPAGQWSGTRPLHGGWLRADAVLLDVLVDAGLPAVDPSPPAAKAPAPGASSQVSGRPERGASGSWPARNAEWLLAGLVALCAQAAVWMTGAVRHRRRIAEPIPGVLNVHESGQAGGPGREAP